MEESIKALIRELKNNDDAIIDDAHNLQILKLSFIGDTIFDLFTRNYLICKYADKIKMNDLHEKNSELVCAKKQAQIIDLLVNDFLTDDEIEFFKHARNAHPHSKSKNSSIVDYRKATGLEALLGLLFYENEDRLYQLLDKIAEIID